MTLGPESMSLNSSQTEKHAKQVVSEDSTETRCYPVQQRMAFPMIGVPTPLQCHCLVFCSSPSSRGAIRVSAMTLGGISKASKGINLSEDIFGGFNFVLRGGKATQAEYIQVKLSTTGRVPGPDRVIAFGLIYPRQTRAGTRQKEDRLRKERSGHETLSAFFVFCFARVHIARLCGHVVVVLVSSFANRRGAERDRAQPECT